MKRPRPALEIWAVSDLHLPGGLPEVDLERLLGQWRASVPPEALVLLGGDQGLSGLQADHALSMLGALPGHKALVPGNHDWPQARSSRLLRRSCATYPDLHPLVGTAWRLEVGEDFGVVVAGTCGARPSMNGGGKHAPCYQQEWHRLKSALAAARRLRGPRDALVVVLHYPPFQGPHQPTGMVRLLDAAGVDLCVYGHVHGEHAREQFQGRRGATHYRLITADAAGLRLVAQMTRSGLHLL